MLEGEGKKMSFEGEGYREKKTVLIDRPPNRDLLFFFWGELIVKKLIVKFVHIVCMDQKLSIYTFTAEPLTTFFFFSFFFFLKILFNVYIQPFSYDRPFSCAHLSK